MAVVLPWSPCSQKRGASGVRPQHGLGHGCYERRDERPTSTHSVRGSTGAVRQRSGLAASGRPRARREFGAPLRVPAQTIALIERMAKSPLQGRVIPLCDSEDPSLSSSERLFG